MFRDFWARLVDRLEHALEDKFTSAFRLFKYFTNDGERETVNLCIHLECCDTFASTSDLEIHISEEILLSLDIREDDVFTSRIIEDHTHSNTWNRRRDRDTSIHESECRSTDWAHWARTITGMNFRDDTDCVAEFFYFWEDRHECFFSEVSMADFTTTNSTHHLYLTDWVRREVVVMHVATLVFWIHTFDEFVVERATECSDWENWCHTTTEMTWTVREREESDFCHDRSYFVTFSAIETTTFFEDVFTHDFFHVFVDEFSNFVSVEFLCIFCVVESSFCFSDDLFELMMKINLTDIVESFDFFCWEDCEDFFFETSDTSFHIEIHLCDRVFCFDSCYEVFLSRREVCEDFLSVLKSTHNHLFACFFSTHFDHRDDISSTSDDELVESIIYFFKCWIKYHTTVFHNSETDTRDCVFKLMHTSELESDAGTCYTPDTEILLTSGRVDCWDNLYFIACSFWEHRTNRSIDKTRVENCRSRRTSFTLVETSATDMTRWVKTLLVVDWEGEPVSSWFTFFADTSCCEEDVTEFVFDSDRTIDEEGKCTSLKCVCLTSDSIRLWNRSNLSDVIVANTWNHNKKWRK